MEVLFWGTRGSIPTPGDATVKYGGNTSCIQVIASNNQFIIFDMGTGIRELGILLNNLKKQLDIHIFLSHTHTDHICGFPFFEPAFVPGNTINIYGPVHYEKSLEEIMTSHMDYSFFPVRTAELNAKISYHDLKEQHLTIGDFSIETKYMNHPVLTLGYKVTADNKTVLYTGDTEPYFNFLGEGDDFSDDEDAETVIEEENKKMQQFISGVDLLICDAQYTAEEYQLKKGWGHSPVEYDLQLALDGGVKKLALFHHDPQRTDDEIDKIVKKSKEWIAREDRGALEVFAAREKQKVEL